MYITFEILKKLSRRRPVLPSILGLAPYDTVVIGTVSVALTGAVLLSLAVEVAVWYFFAPRPPVLRAVLAISRASYTGQETREK
jgi:hypothetical protein